MSWCDARAAGTAFSFPPPLFFQTNAPPPPLLFYSLLWDGVSSAFPFSGARVPPFHCGVCRSEDREQRFDTPSDFFSAPATKKSHLMSDDVECPKRLLEERCKPTCTKYALAYEVRRERERRGRGRQGGRRRCGRGGVGARAEGCATLCGAPPRRQHAATPRESEGGGERRESVRTRALRARFSPKHASLALTHNPPTHHPFPPHPTSHTRRAPSASRTTRRATAWASRLTTCTAWTSVSTPNWTNM